MKVYPIRFPAKMIRNIERVAGTDNRSEAIRKAICHSLECDVFQFPDLKTDDTITLPEIAKKLDKPYDTVKFWVYRNKLKAKKEGGIYKVKMKDLYDFLGISTKKFTEFTDDLSEYLTVKEAAKKYNKSKDNIYFWISERLFRFRMIGNEYRIYEPSFKLFLEQRQKPTISRLDN